MARIRMDSAAEMLYESPKEDNMNPELLKALEEKATLKVRLDSSDATSNDSKAN